jgi:hypothetical protein
MLNPEQTPQVLRLQYTCTKAERDEAQTLVTREQLGGGSKWLAKILLYLMLIGLLLEGYFKFDDMPKLRRLEILGAIILGSTVFVILKNRLQKEATDQIKIEVSIKNFTILDKASKAAIAWSSISNCYESSGLFVLLHKSNSLSYIVPKRAFPSEDWQAWFRALANHKPEPDQTSTIESVIAADSKSTNIVIIRFKLGLRDYFDRCITSWLTWTIALAMEVLVLAALLSASANPAPNGPARPALDASFLLFPLVMPIVLMIALFTIQPWLSQRKHSTSQEVALSEDGIFFNGGDGSGNLAWSTFTNFKETQNCFILARRWTRVWFLLPKGSFATREDVQRCRWLLEGHLRRSKWLV